MHDLGRWEAVEGRAVGGALGAHISDDLQVRELLGQADGIERVAGGAKADLFVGSQSIADWTTSSICRQRPACISVSGRLFWFVPSLIQRL
jgi:hypothetical protein